MPKPHRKKIRHYDGKGDARELTFSCHHRKQFFSKPHVCDWFINALIEARNKHPIHLWAYVVMPEHIHLLVWPFEPKFEIKDLLKSIKLSVSKVARNDLEVSNPAYLKANGGRFRFWQPGPGYDRNLHNDRTIWSSIDYIHRNPVRRGLCERIEDWPWSSAVFYSGKESGVKIDRESIPVDPRRQ